MWHNVLNLLKQWDTWLFLKINTEWTNSFLDYNFPWYREATAWIPLYFFFLLFVFFNFGWRIWPWVILIILTLTITDQMSSNFLKNWFNRPRPCNDAFLMDKVRLLLNRCPSSQSFTSSHATNHFGAATLIYFTLKPVLKKWGYLLFIWAATICYGQIYVGVHYPLDVLGGAVVGLCIGYGMAWLYNKYIGLPPLLNNSVTTIPAPDNAFHSPKT